MLTRKSIILIILIQCRATARSQYGQLGYSSTDRTRVKIIFFSDSASEMLVGKLSARGFQIRSPIVKFASRFVFTAH